MTETPLTPSQLHLKKKIEQFHDTAVSAAERSEALRIFTDFRSALGNGEIRAAENVEGVWRPVTWVKMGILLGFRIGVFREVGEGGKFKFFDKTTLPLKHLSQGHEVRVVPGGSAIREGAYVAKGVICMPPMYINIGAYVDENSMIDSHALVGSCAQIGKRVHISAGAQIGGVLEPVGALPVVIEDDVLVGGNCGVYEGAVVQAGAVLAAGVIITGGTAVYDLVRKEIYRRTEHAPLVIPQNAVVVPGSRPLSDPWASERGLAVATPIVVKYRDGKTDLSTLLEGDLR
jgi:2,3,4,5-tetrahydropyridine-2-carboxylate N-succinyltransferase